jgi:hypothetical protein
MDKELAAELLGIAQLAEMIEHLSHMIKAKVRDLSEDENVTGIALLVERLASCHSCRGRPYHRAPFGSRNKD